ncbi:MAG: tetratricopeptide repeat protein, partial [Opitutaceae bacterium]
GLAATWILLAGLRTSVNQRGVGFGYGMTAWDYALTSCRSLVRYLELAFWPHPLVFDYSVDGVRRMATVWPFVLVLSLLVAGVAIALQRRAAIGFAGAWFFLILAPTSSFVPIAGQPMAEHRMYLPLAGVIALAVFGLYRWGGRRSLILWAVLSVGLGCLTVRRNEDYRSALAIWSDTAAKQPRNARANNNLGLILADLPGRLTEAIYRYETALRIDPYFAEAHNNLGLALSHVPGHLAEAIAHYNAALRIDPHSAEAHNNLGLALSHVPGHLAEAIAHYQTALCLQPDLAEAHNNLGLALAQFPGRRSEAIAHFEAALLIDPNFAVAHNNLGVALSAEPGRLAEAISQFAAALRIDPDLLPARQMLDKLRATPPQAGQK